MDDRDDPATIAVYDEDDAHPVGIVGPDHPEKWAEVFIRANYTPRDLWRMVRAARQQGLPKTSMLLHATMMEMLERDDPQPVGNQQTTA